MKEPPPALTFRRPITFGHIADCHRCAIRNAERLLATIARTRVPPLLPCMRSWQYRQRRRK